ncbi:MAG TPA: phosphoglycerate kinase, partial [Gammaproteobacteria bacterium]|nr:phosphoglycerate kinase [Gammaproteobacteria bacterium]
MRNLQDLPLENKRVLIREDFNVPLKGGVIANDARIVAALPTIEYALKHKAAVLLLSHLGRPKEGIWDAAFSLAPVADKLFALLGQPIRLIENIQGECVVKPGEVVLLENTRFLVGEADNDPLLGKQLARLCDIFVMDAFAVAHRAQASTVAVAKYAPEVCAGFLLQKEVTALNTVLKSIKRPLVAVVGGAKVSTKLKLLQNLLDKVDTLIVGGGIANTFLAAQGVFVGASLFERELVPMAKMLLEIAKSKNKQLVLPIDVVVAKSKEDPKGEIKDIASVLKEEMILDIGPQSILKVQAACQDAGTFLWNGTLGAAE